MPELMAKMKASLTKRMEGKDRERPAAKTDVDRLADKLARMTTTTTKSDPTFGGGFRHELHDNVQAKGNGRHKPLPATSNGTPIAFPVPDTTYPRPGPLPNPPPVIRMPEPEVPRQHSLATQFALQMQAEGALAQSPAALRPPPADYAIRPHSDPEVTRVSESISTPLPRPKPPTTPKKTNARPPRTPQTNPIKTSISQGEPVSPTRKGRQRSSSVSSAPASSTYTSKGDLRCSAITLLGSQCTRKGKVNPALAYLIAGDPELAEEVQIFCGQHQDKVFDKDRFLSPVTKDYVHYSDFIPNYLHSDTQAALRALMTELATPSDRDGYIYCFEIIDDNEKGFVFLKVGRTVEFNKRMDEWVNQCPSREQHPRGRWPAKPGENVANPLGRLEKGPMGKFCYRLERLIHIELADMVQYRSYLDKDFPHIALTAKNDRPVPSKKPCVDCSKVHKEIFAFERAPKGHPFHKHEFERIVKPIVEKWSRFVEEHVVQAPKL